LSDHAAHAHQFDSAAQQHEAASLGMWAFLVTEVMFFGGLIVCYVVYRNLYFPAFAAASRELDVNLGAINTAVLICSSLTMALAVRAAQLGNRRTLITCLFLTLLLGSTFLGIKGVEYYDKFVHHHVPGPHFQFDGDHPEQAQLFFSLYFAMTGLHALHMIVGAGILIALIYHSWRGRYSPAYFAPVEMSGLYWHFVDIVWIFLFPFLYLLSRH
jgi:cytochrome c oxidase subunit III